MARQGAQASSSPLLQIRCKPATETADRFEKLLYSVAAGSSVPCLKVLIQAGANPNIRTSGTTPLLVASCSGNIEVIKFLLEAGGDPNTCNDDGLKPIQVASLRDKSEVVKLLLPLTYPIPGVSNWTADGIKEFMQSEAVEEKAQVEDATRESEKFSTLRYTEVCHDLLSQDDTQLFLEARGKGYEAFNKSDYIGAVHAFTKAPDLNPNDAKLLSNRSLCWLLTGLADSALEDAKACGALSPHWPEACYREGAALYQLQRFYEAASVFHEAALLDPENDDFV